jgi:Domain of unknown function (DUF4386)
MSVVTSVSSPTARWLAPTVGVLFIAAFVAYGGGSAIADGAIDDPVANRSALAIGGLMILMNSAFVIGIGVLVHQLLPTHRVALARAYFAGRIVEATFLAVGGLFLLAIPALANSDPSWVDAARALNDMAFLIAMLALAVVSVPLCLALTRERVVPIWLGVWGVVGYGVLAVGVATGFFGNDSVELFAAIGGGFEIVFGLFLIARFGRVG